MFRHSDKVEHKTFGMGKVVEELGKGAHGERLLVKFDKGGEKILLAGHLVNHSESDRSKREKERVEVEKIKRRKMVIDSQALDGLDDESEEPEEHEEAERAAVPAVEAEPKEVPLVEEDAEKDKDEHD